jgi:hypothetical protein
MQGLLALRKRLHHVGVDLQSEKWAVAAKDLLKDEFRLHKQAARRSCQLR